MFIFFRNRSNGKIYVGKTNNIDRRKIEHLSKSKASTNHHFYNAIKKYGFESFDLEIAYECENEFEIYEKESYYITLYKSNDKSLGYNSTSGGEGLRDASLETRQKMSDNGKLRVGNKNSFYGKHHTNSTKEKISNANMGNQSWLGKHHTDEAKQKISKANTGRTRTPEEKSKLSQINSGENSSTAKTTNEQAKEIRQKHANGVPSKNLEKEYGLSKSSINKIVNFKTFRRI